MAKQFEGLVKFNWLLVAIVALALGLRWWNIDFGLPYTVAPDEPWHLTIALRMFRNLDLDPHWLNYPTLMFYLNALAYVPFFVFGKLLGVVDTPFDIPYPDSITVGVGKSLMPSQFLLGRGLTALIGVGAVIVIYFLARRLHSNRAVAYGAAFFLAISPASVSNSHLIRPDTFVVFFVLLSCLYALKILDDPRLSNYVWTGIFAGLAVSSKYNVPLIVVPLVVAHFLRWGWAGLRRKEVYIGLIVSGFAFALTTPFAFINFQQFLRDMGYETTKQISGGHTGSEGNTLWWYLDYLKSVEGILVIAALLGMIHIFLTRSKRGWVGLSFPLTYFVFISVLTVRNDRTILPVLPFLDLLAACFVVQLGEWIVSQRILSRRLAIAASLVCVALFSFVPLQNAIASNAQLNVTNNLDIARQWIEQNLPQGARIAVEAYAPYVDPRRYVVEGVDGMIAHPIDWYTENGFEYLVFSYGAYGRFFENATRYSDAAQQYDAFFNRFTEVKRFKDSGAEIRIYKTGVSNLPSNRVAARFGIYSNWLEFVGYDVKPSIESQLINATLYWRILEPRYEPLTLTVRLLDRNDHEIAPTSGALFSNEPATNRIIRIPWRISTPAAPGLYRLELDVDAEGQGRIPVLSRTYEKISDKLFVGPIKVSPPPISSDELQRAHASNVRFGDALTLLGYSTTSQTVAMCGKIETTVYWKTIAAIEKDYTVFLHVLDSTGKVVAQLDIQPLNGMYPTSVWRVGEVVSDTLALALPCDVAPGDYRIELGMYEYPSLVRLGVTSMSGTELGDHILFDDVIKVTK